MGLFDSITFVKPDQRFACADGHVHQDGWQTKDLGAAMVHYHVMDGQFFTAGTKRSRVDDRDGNLVSVMEQDLIPAVDIDALSVAVYRNCRLCKPVLSMSNGYSVFGDSVAETWPWIEFDVSIVRGVISDVKAGRVETREEVRKKLIARGTEVLDDGERIALRHFKLREERLKGDID